MKQKFSSIGRVAIALMLALSLSLVMAVPVSAVSGIDVTPNPTTAEEVAEYTVVFTTTEYLMEGTSDKIYIEFPSGTDIAGYNGAVTINTVAAASFTVSNQILEITVPTSGGDVAPGSVTVFLDDDAANDITNPEAGDYTLHVWTNEEPTHVESNPYTITPVVDTTPPNAVTVIAPNGAETWAAGSTQSITWSGGGDAIDTATTIKLEYSDDAGSNWSDITTLADTALTGYSWTVPSVDSTNCLVKVTATDDAANSVSDVSDAEFTIDSALPTVAVTVPNGGEVWVEGSSHDITWTCTDTDLVANPIDIDYSTDGGATWTREATNELNDGTYPWTVPTVYSTNCLVKVTATDDAANSASDVSDAVFTIDDTTDPLTVTVADPNGGETWAAGSTQSITWSGGTDAIDSATTIKLEYSADAGSSWTDITTLADTADTSYSWVIPSIDSTNCLVKVTATDNAANSVSDVSGAVFSIAAATEVWVDDDGDDLYPGTEALPFATIQKGIDQSGAGGTVNVLPGTYTLTDTYAGVEIPLTRLGLTLQSTGGAEVTILDAGVCTLAGIYIVADDVTVDGFTVVDGLSDGILINYGHEGTTLTNNIIRDIVHSGIALNHASQVPTSAVAEATILSNVIEGCGAGINLAGCALDCTISDNTITDCGGEGIGFEGGSIADPAKGNTITGNRITGNTTRGIWLNASETAPNSGLIFEDNVIEGNTISGNTAAGIEIEASLNITNLTITSNSITNNDADGIFINSVTWGAGNTISNNNIVDNVDEGIDNNCSTVINAENNWWGADSGPWHTTTNATASGEAVSDNVDYRPWLTAAYAAPVDPVTTIELAEGWNLISLMLIPEDSAITTVLADLITLETVDQVQTYSPDIEDFLQWASSGPMHDNPTLTAMDAGVGFWLEMNSAGTLVATGYELCEPAPAVPPQYEVAIGWNLIGFKFTQTGTINGYLGDVSTTLDAIYGYVDGAYFIPTNLEPGLGYWIAVTSAGTIYPNLVSPN